ncbi:MAG: phosphotransferase family protein [Armatimonadetes bacterium]|nr:phosphotransferase family protein [Armatimonadota bacterium]
MPLTIDEAIARIPLWKRAATLSVAALPGGITNQNYRVDADGQAFVVRIGAAGAELLGIDRRREYRCMVAASRTGVAPEVVYVRPRDGILVTRFLTGRSLAPGRPVPPQVRERVVRAMHRYHAGPAFAGSFSPTRTLEAYRAAARAGRTRLPRDIDILYEQVLGIASALRRGRPTPHPCHNDLWGPNLIDDGRRVRIVDWEYAGMGDISFDLANFAIYHCSTDTADAALLATYFGRVRGPALARLKLMKSVAELREAMWYMVALRVSPARRDFVDAAATHFERCRQALDDPRLPGWLQAVTPRA